MTSAETYVVSSRNCENNLPINITIVSSLDQKSARAYLGGKKGDLIASFEMNMQSSTGIANIISNVTVGLNLIIAATMGVSLERELFHLTAEDIQNLDYRLLSMKTLHLNLTASKLQLQTKNFVEVNVRISSSDSIYGIVECPETGEALSISATKKGEITLYTLEGLAICNLKLGWMLQNMEPCLREINLIQSYFPSAIVLRSLALSF